MIADKKLGRYVPLLVWIIAALTIVVIPLKVIGLGFLPPDDALRHAARAVTGRPWAEILVLGDVMKMEHNFGWHALLRGIPMAKIMAEMFGKQEGCSGGRGGSMHLFDATRRFYGGNAIVAGGLPTAAGLAFADAQLKRNHPGKGRLTVGMHYFQKCLATLFSSQRSVVSGQKPIASYTSTEADSRLR